MKLRYAGIALLVASSSYLAPRVAKACSCLPPPAPAKAADQSVAVFQGTVLSKRSEPGEGIGQLVFTFQVDRQIKGRESDSGGTLQVQTADNSAACGREFEQGKAYLVYAYAEKDGIFVDNACSRTRLVDQAQEDLAALENYTPGSGGSEDPQGPGTGAEPDPKLEPQPQPNPFGGDPAPTPEAPEDPPSPQGSDRGCSVTGHSTPGGLPAMLALLGLTALVRRTRPRA